MDDYETTRQRIWSGKDTLPRELQFLQPLNAASNQYARIMVGPRKYLNQLDAANQSLAASAVTAVTFTGNDILANSWERVPAGFGIVWELIRGVILATDASGKIQITSQLNLSGAPGSVAELATLMAPPPVTLAASASAYFAIMAKIPMLAYLPTDGGLPNGPSASFLLINTDSAGAHTYKRQIVVIYRYIYDVDYTKERVYIMGTLT